MLSDLQLYTSYRTRTSVLKALTLAEASDLKWTISAAPTPPSACSARVHKRIRVMSALHVRTDPFACQATYLSYKHTHTRSGSAGLSYRLRVEAGHLGGSNASLRLRCARAQAYTGDECPTCAHRPFPMPGDLHILQAHAHALWKRTPELQVAC